MKRILSTSVVVAALLSGCGGTTDSTDDGKDKSEPKADTFEDKAYERGREQFAEAKNDNDAVDADAARKFHATYEIKVDASRTLEVEIAGLYQAIPDIEDADAGKADIQTLVSGIAKITNTSDGRAVEDFDHSLVVQLGAPLCPKTCTHKLTDIPLAGLEPGDSLPDVAMDAHFQWVGTVNEDEADAAVKSANDGILIAEKTSVFGGDYLDVNETCPGNRVIFWSEDPAAAKC